MIYKILEISKVNKTLYNSYTKEFNSREDMINYCLGMDNDLYFYYGASVNNE